MVVCWSFMALLLAITSFTFIEELLNVLLICFKLLATLLVSANYGVGEDSYYSAVQHVIATWSMSVNDLTYLLIWQVVPLYIVSNLCCDGFYRTGFYLGQCYILQTLCRNGHRDAYQTNIYTQTEDHRSEESVRSHLFLLIVLFKNIPLPSKYQVLQMFDYGLGLKSSLTLN